MRVLRGRAETVEADRALVAKLREHAAETGEPAVRVWRPHPQVAFGRRDVDASGYERARRVVRQRGFSSVERTVGGRAVAHTGETVAFCRAEPVEDAREGLQERYDRAVEALAAAFADCGVEPSRGEPDDAFCPGSHSLAADGCKLAGVAQRVTTEAALVGGIAIPRDRWTVAETLQPVYDALGVPFDPSTVGSLRAAGGDGDPDELVASIEAALVGDADADVEEV